MTLLEALKIAQRKARSEISSEMWRNKKYKSEKCKVSICKINNCPLLETTKIKGRYRQICKKTKMHVSNMFIHKMECQSKWVNPESKM